ncbi:MAG: hypothetical protein L0Y79_08720 [Chlorobi bacterium]|nr:hypothetical protein [Chlorobiota bacterium]MCI0716391.1 hypothetical protein [Chlorobiota bacterium]
MENSKLHQLLKTFSKSEFDALGKFIYSPFYNTSLQITKLYKILSNYYPELNSPRLTKEKIYMLIYRSGKFDDKKIRDLYSRMLKLTQEFIAVSEFKTMPVLQKRLVLEKLAGKNLEKHFTSLAKELENILDREEITDGEYFFNRYTLMKEKRSYMEIQKSVGKREKFFGDITKEIDAFIYYAIYKIIKYYLTFQIHSRLIKHDYDYKLRKEVLDYLEKNPATDYPVIMIHYHMVLMNINLDDDDSYYKATRLLEKNTGSIKQEDLKLIYTELFNYTRIRSATGSREFHNENYRILKDMVAKGVYPVEGNYLTENALITIFSAALIEKDFDWALEFLDEHIGKIPKEAKENALSYCIGILNYRKGKYTEALEKLSKVSIEDFYHHMRVKNHEIKIFFELGDFEKVMFTVDSFRHFLNLNKLIPDYIRIRYLNYVNFTGRLANALLSASPADKIIPIKKEIEKHDVAALENQQWLLEQIEKALIK